MKGRKLLKKLCTIPSIECLKPHRIHHQILAASDGFVDTHLEKNSNVKVVQSGVNVKEPDVIDVEELMRDLKDLSFYEDLQNKDLEHNLLRSEPQFRQIRALEASEARPVEDPLLGFEEKCPPGGADSIIFYTTTLRGIRKTFEECNSIRFLLESFGVQFFEREVSMHMEFKEELWRVLDDKHKPLPPRLFIKGRYIGAAEEVLALNEQGKLSPLFQGVPMDRSNGAACEGCAGFRLVLCFNCNGSRKVVADDGKFKQCEVCNENGLILCPCCC